MARVILALEVNHNTLQKIENRYRELSLDGGKFWEIENDILPNEKARKSKNNNAIITEDSISGLVSTIPVDALQDVLGVDDWVTYFYDNAVDLITLIQ